MIPFDFRLLGRLTCLSFLKSGNTDAPLTPRRAVGLIFGLLGFLLFETFNFFFLLLDEVCYRGYRGAQIYRPVFIVGNPRSGTTFLHRVLSLDEKRFFGFRMWEILFPSIIQKKLIDLLGRADRLIGAPFHRMIENTEKRILGEFVDLHSTGLFYLEEDEMLFLHCFSSLYLVFFFPFYDLLRDFAQFDLKINPARRKRLMEFYRRCLMRQAFVRAKAGMIFLSKNPMFSGKIESLRRTFPDLRIIYTVRNPLEAIPSMLSEGHATCVFGEPGRPPSKKFQENVYEIAQTFYRYPLKRAEEKKEPLYIINYHDLVTSPAATITRLYEDLGLKMTPEFRACLDEEEKKAEKYRSKHVYSIKQFAISEERIKTDFKDIMERFGFLEAKSGAERGRAREDSN